MTDLIIPRGTDRQVEIAFKAIKAKLTVLEKSIPSSTNQNVANNTTAISLLQNELAALQAEVDALSSSVSSTASSDPFLLMGG